MINIIIVILIIVFRVFIGGEWLSIPSAPAKYDKFLRARASILREISNMLQLTEHPNILRLHEVRLAAWYRCVKLLRQTDKTRA